MKTKHIARIRLPFASSALLVVFASFAAFAADKSSYQEFDQTPHQGWRALADKKQFHEAAAIIEAYLSAHPELDQSQFAILHFHAAQTLAIGDDPHAALKHLRLANVDTESPFMHWNDYVAATSAFLKGDLRSLKAARERLAAGPKFHGEVLNLDVVDRLVANFGKPYAEAYADSDGASRVPELAPGSGDF